MEISNLKTIIGRFSDFSKMPKPELERIDAKDVIERVRALYDAAASREAKIDFVTEIAGEPMTIMVDPELLHRALSNLVLNAMDAMPNGGTLTLSAHPRGREIEIRVADTGEGLTPEECERLFTPYYTTKQHGTGLGLAIVQSVVADHGGTIAVESRTGSGATFIITLPRARRMSAKANILIVDDEANTLASLSRAFRLAGHEAVVCDNAERALELAQTQPFDLILSDVVMPRRDGLALLEDLKTAGVTAPVVMMSGQAHIEMAVRATRLGALDFLEKPLSTEKLLVTVENALKLTRLEIRESRPAHARRQAHAGVERRNDAPRDGADRARGGQRNAHLHLRRNRHGQRAGGADAAREKSRAAGPFVTLNCAAVPAELIESELFGHEKGSFTGAAQRHAGKFEQAHRGTLVPRRDWRHADRRCRRSCCACLKKAKWSGSAQRSRRLSMCG